jgi:hypothetical protein
LCRLTPISFAHVYRTKKDHPAHLNDLTIENKEDAEKKHSDHRIISIDPPWKERSATFCFVSRQSNVTRAKTTGRFDGN